MKKKMIWLWITLASVLGLIALVLGVGALVEREHVATVKQTYQASPEEVWAAITTFEGMEDWRHGVKKVEILEPLDGVRRIREHSSFGPMTYLIEEETPPSKLLLRIADDNQGFGGTWTYEIREVADGTELQITEDGFVDNLFFRFMSRFIFGYESTMRTYHSSLQGKLEG